MTYRTDYTLKAGMNMPEEFRADKKKGDEGKIMHPSPFLLESVNKFTNAHSALLI